MVDLKFERTLTELVKDDPSKFTLIDSNVSEKPTYLICSKRTRCDFWNNLGRLSVVPRKANWDERPLHFCNPTLNLFERRLIRLLNALDDKEKARRIRNANPFENVKRLFSSRDANKLTNLDRIFRYEITQDQQVDIRMSVYCPYFFAVIASGMSIGSYSEYVIRRKRSSFCKSFGFSSDHSHLYSPENIRNSWPHFIDIFYRNNHTDITKLNAQQNFSDFIREGTNGEGVALCLADALGWHPSEPYHELYYMKMFVAKLACSLRILRRNGNLVATFFEMNTAMSAGLFYLLYCCFDKVSIHKPNASRPHNPERFIVCFGYHRDLGSEVVLYLNRLLEVWDSEKGMEVCECLPVKVLRADMNFKEYLINSNEKILKKQIEFLEHIVSDRKFVENYSLELAYQKYLSIPSINDYRAYQRLDSPEEMFVKFRDSHSASALNKCHNFDFEVYMSISTEQPSIICSTLNGTFILENKKWIKTENVCIPPSTILLIEYNKFSSAFDVSTNFLLPCIRILDCAVLYGRDVSGYTLRTRLKACSNFLRAITPTSGLFHYNMSTLTSHRPIQMFVASTYSQLSQLPCRRAKTFEELERGITIVEDGFRFSRESEVLLSVQDTFWKRYNEIIRGRIKKFRKS